MDVTAGVTVGGTALVARTAASVSECFDGEPSNAAYVVESWNAVHAETELCPCPARALNTTPAWVLAAPSVAPAKQTAVCRLVRMALKSAV